MKVTIKEWNAVATWRWDIPEDDVCGICQVHFDGTCPSCKYPGDDCTLRTASLQPHLLGNTDMRKVSGKCGHNFHMVSIQLLNFFFWYRNHSSYTDTHFSTASWNGLNRTPHEGSVLCADSVSMLWQRIVGGR